MSGKVEERRRFRRVPISTMMEVESGAESYTVTAENISPGGMLIRCSKTLNEGQKVKLRFTLPDTKIELRVNGVVQHVSPGAFMGVRFENLTPEQTQTISLFIEAKEK